MRIFIILFASFFLLAAPAAFGDDAERTAKKGFKEIHKGMKHITKSIHKKARKGTRKIDKKAKKGWKKVGSDIKKATKD